MSGDVRVHSWPCSYYLDLEKQWVPGKLTLTPHSLKFSADRTEEVLVGLPLSSITEIRKEASLFIFSAITVLEKGQAKHWFSSLRPSRNVVFNIIEHFWRELLLSQPGSATSTASPMTRGQELMGLMAISQRRMEDTSKVLHHQGEQLDSVMRGLEKMESDLDVADRWANPKVCSASAGKAEQCSPNNLMVSSFPAPRGKAVHLLSALCGAHPREPLPVITWILLVHRE